MPRAQEPSIRGSKLAAGFTADKPGERIYSSWRTAVKNELETRGITSSSDPGVSHWNDLTRWALTRVPLNPRAALHGGTSAAAVKFTDAVDHLLRDVLKKLKFSRRGRVSLTPPPVPVQGLSHPCLVHPALRLVQRSTNQGCL
jgi:hypothetical protein